MSDNDLKDKKVAMISQPTRGKSDTEIEAVRNKAIDVLREMGYNVLDTWFKDDWAERTAAASKNPPAVFLGRSILKLGECDAVYFCKGWEEARGCRIERIVAKEYGLEIIDEDNDNSGEYAIYTFDQYQKDTRETAIYPIELAIPYTSLGLAGESGEVCEKVKKVIRDKGGVFGEEDIANTAKEIGDCGWYAARLADELGVNYGKVAWENRNKLFSRKARGVLHGNGDNR